MPQETCAPIDVREPKKFRGELVERVKLEKLVGVCEKLERVKQANILLT